MDIMSIENAECIEEVSFLFVNFNSSFYSLNPLHTMRPPFGQIACLVTFTCICSSECVHGHMIFMIIRDCARLYFFYYQSYHKFCVLQRAPCTPTHCMYNLQYIKFRCHVASVPNDVSHFNTSKSVFITAMYCDFYAVEFSDLKYTSSYLTPRNGFWALTGIASMRRLRRVPTI